MFTEYGHKLLLAAIAAGLPRSQARFTVGGGRVNRLYPTDPGYPKLGDTEEANGDRGEYVLTWRFTVPKGAGWGLSPAERVELVDEHETAFYDTALPRPFFAPTVESSILFVNLVFRR